MVEIDVDADELLLRFRNGIEMLYWSELQRWKKKWKQTRDSELMLFPRTLFAYHNAVFTSWCPHFPFGLLLSSRCKLVS